MDQEFPGTPEDAFCNTGSSPLLPSMTLWDLLKCDLPPISRSNTPSLVLGVDAAVGRSTGPSDYFALTLVSRHWDRSLRDQVVVWDLIAEQAKPGHSIDTIAFEQRIVDLCRSLRVQAVAYDPYQMAHMAKRLEQIYGIYCKPIGQTAEQLDADSLFLELIMAKRLHHGGHPLLREHVANSDRRLEDSRDPGSMRKLRIVKRSESLKIDGCKAAALACKVVLEL